MAEALVAVDGLCRSFGHVPGALAQALGRRKTPVLRAVDGVSFRIMRGHTLGLVGESGCGKSTVARCVAGLLPLTAGSVRIAGRDIASIASGEAGRDARRQIQMIFQDPFASLNPRWRVGKTLADPLRAFEPGIGKTALAEKVSELLAQVGLSAADATKYPHAFSGGQRQRIAIARALAAAPSVIIADEPTSALDVSVQAQILNLLREAQRLRGVAYLFISHNLAVVEHMADTVAVMYLGRIVELRETNALFATPAHPYTRLLIETIPSVRRIGVQPAAFGGEVADPRRPPTGCAFHPRCALATARCRIERPELLPIAGGAVACHVSPVLGNASRDNRVSI